MRTRTRTRTNFGGRSMKTQNPPSPFWRMLKTLSVYLRTPEYVRSHKNCIVYPKFGDSAAVHFKVQYSPYSTTVRFIRTSITLPGTVLYTWHIRTRYQEHSGMSYMVPGILPVFIYRTFQGCVLQGTYRTYPGYLPRVLPYKELLYVCRTFIPVPGTSVSSVRHSYTSPELL